MLQNEKLNEYYQKMLWTESVHTCKCVINSMSNTVSTTIPFENFYGEKPKIIGSFSDFGRIAYITKREIFKKQMADKTFKATVVGHADNHTRGR